ncbi:Myb-like DNA-binding domain-containing protein [Spironucleus salmonicida]|uniref:Myb-like DNA-binding domain-containing protein n=1 Tax=Spironucleus salmonicida TaxID=348837 RepID=V6M1H9_9EUKA|nr:Myb-like DNA-binding domain-containing protein [Spironucleus salmonicida]|eukprot:EST47044.1 Myb-like DNA-binding domain-containing protein [Spironucleus salmonicida]
MEVTLKQNQLNKLIHVVQKLRNSPGGINWDKVVAQFPTYSRQYIQNKYYGYVRRNKCNEPELAHNHKWTDDEKNQLINAVQLYGTQWIKVQKILPNFTLSQLKNKYSQLDQRLKPQTQQRTDLSELFPVYDRLDSEFSLIGNIFID